MRAGATAARLLPGESWRTDFLDDAEHWTAVYEELTAFLVRAHANDPDQMDRFRTRLDYWRHRRAELED